MPRSFLVKRRRLSCEESASAADYADPSAVHNECRTCCPQDNVHKKANLQSVQDYHLTMNPSTGSPFHLCQSQTYGLPVLRNRFVGTRVSCTAGSCYHWPRLCPCEGCSLLRRPVTSPSYVVPPARLFFPTNVQFCCNGISCSNIPLRKEIKQQIPRDIDVTPCRHSYPHRDFIPKSTIIEKDKDKLYDLNSTINNEISQPRISSEIVPRRPRVIVLTDDRDRPKQKSNKLLEKKRDKILKEEKSSPTGLAIKSESSPTCNENDKELEAVSPTEEIIPGSKVLETNVTQAATPVTVCPNLPSNSVTSLDSTSTTEAGENPKTSSEDKKSVECVGKRRRYNTRNATPQSRIFNEDFVTPCSVGDWAKDKGSAPRGRYRSKLNRLLANEHERRRVAQLNLGYQKLRKAIPGYQCDTKLPKIKILRYAIAYIDKLDILLGADQMEPSTSGDENNNNIIASPNKTTL